MAVIKIVMTYSRKIFFSREVLNKLFFVRRFNGTEDKNDMNGYMDSLARSMTKKASAKRFN